MADHRAGGGEALGGRAQQIREIRIAAVALSAVENQGRAASALLPVRSTLVAPILPDPMLRTSPLPASRVSNSPNGIEPSR